MANSARNQPGVERTERITSVEQDSNPLDKLQGFYETNKKAISTITTIILVVVVGYLAYTRLIKGPQEEKASAAMSYPQTYFMMDSLNLALNGDGQHPGFSKLAKKYDGTSSGNLAHYYEGICYLKMGDFKNAIKSLKEFDGKGTMVAYQAWGALGEAYKESGDNNNAIESFKKATGDKDNTMITPMYLYQLGIAYEDGGKSKDAVDAFKRIRDEFPRSMQARDVEKELARLGQVD
jgi:tetratricopeptide (TPR) repeat protein